jgi:hypothetical protein
MHRPVPRLDITDSTDAMIAFSKALLAASRALDSAPPRRLQRALRVYQAALYRAREQLSLSRLRN